MENLQNFTEINYCENIIIGAGPAGLQCAYFFKKYAFDYLVLERNSKAGSFFEKFPHSGKLISINKKYTGNDNQDFNLRHDWNSLLNDEGLLFTKYSNSFYPPRDKLFEYLNDFANINNLNISYNKEIDKISKDNNFYFIFIKNTKEIFKCSKLIIATGLSRKKIPDIQFDITNPVKYYSDIPTNFFINKINDYVNKKIIIVGGGNSGFELANLLNEVASSVVVIVKNDIRWSISTHNAGDLRTVYVPFIDTFSLKSLNGIECLVKPFKIQEINNKYYYLIENNKISSSFDEIFICTGWTFDNSIFDFYLGASNKNNIPESNELFESTYNKNLFFIGEIMKASVKTKSSAGFIHGFRYLIKNFVNIHYNIPFDFKIFDYDSEYESLINHIIYRINNNSDMYQMYGVIGDVMFINHSLKKIIYCHNFYHNYIQYFIQKILSQEINYFQNINYSFDFAILISLDFGNNLNKLPLIFHKKSVMGDESNSKYIHPVLFVLKKNSDIIIDKIHFDENLLAIFDDKEIYFDKFFRTIKMFI